MSRRVAAICIVAFWLPLGVACVDIRAFSGHWSGPIVPEPAVRQGFAENTRVSDLHLENVNLQQLSAWLSTTDEKFNNTSLTRVIRTASDTLASLTFDGDPLRSYLVFAALDQEPTESAGTTPPPKGPAMMIISLYADDHIELRIIRGNDLFGIFRLTRDEEE